MCGRCPGSVLQLLLFECVSVGNLRDQLRSWRGEGRGGKIPLQQLKALCIGVTAGLEHVHGAGIVLGDVCAANVTLDDRLAPKLSSFRYARRISSDVVDGANSLVALSKHKLHSRWLAPEMLAGTESSATIAGDIWALGVTIWEICTLSATPYTSLQETRGVLASVAQKNRLALPAWATHARGNDDTVLALAG